VIVNNQTLIYDVPESIPQAALNHTPGDDEPIAPQRRREVVACAMRAPIGQHRVAGAGSSAWSSGPSGYGVIRRGGPAAGDQNLLVIEPS
jgi:hypothetical protein